MKNLTLICLSALALVAFQSSAQQYVYPANGQSPEQQQQDEYECHAWAVSESGFDPTQASNPGTVAQAPPTTATGSTPGAGASGAVRGAAAGVIIGDSSESAAKGAAAGAVLARSSSRRHNRRARAETEAVNEAVQQDYAAHQDGYNKARSVCLKGRGYTVE